MQAATGVPASTDLVGAFDQCLHSVSHDLRSPLLTMSLGTELIADAVVADDDRTALALDSLRSGAKDLERMLGAITLPSRARKRTLTDSPSRPWLRSLRDVTPSGRSQESVEVEGSGDEYAAKCHRGEAE